MISEETLSDVVAECARSTRDLADEVRKLRLIFEEFVEPGANENFPGYIRVRDRKGAE